MTAATDAGSTDIALLHETVGANLEATARRYPDREALVVVHQAIRQTYCEFDETVDRVARGLMALGIERGDRVGMWSPNRAEWVYIQYASAKIGAIQVNVNPAYRTSELRYAMEQSGCRLLVTCTAHLTSDYRAMVDEVAPQLPPWSAPSMSTPTTGPTCSPAPRPSPSTPFVPVPPSSTPTIRSTSSTRRAPPGGPKAPPSATSTS